MNALRFGFASLIWIPVLIAYLAGCRKDSNWPATDGSGILADHEGTTEAFRQIEERFQRSSTMALGSKEDEGLIRKVGVPRGGEIDEIRWISADLVMVLAHKGSGESFTSFYVVYRREGGVWKMGPWYIKRMS